MQHLQVLLLVIGRDEWALLMHAAGAVRISDQLAIHQPLLAIRQSG
jgi:hypothetical protein